MAKSKEKSTRSFPQPREAGSDAPDRNVPRPRETGSDAPSLSPPLRGGRGVTSFKHEEEKRKNIPTLEHRSFMDDNTMTPTQKAYARRDPDLDPQLIWKGKEMMSEDELVVQAPPLYIQEKIHSKVLINDLLRESKKIEKASNEQLDLFGDFNGIPKEVDKTEFYQHDQNWTNRMILGDSLQVMASLSEREGLRGKVQCIYIDPPYGIKFNSNFQWSTTNRDVKDNKATHITREPEQVKAFRDTWRDGIHSYLSYLRDRLIVARDLLTESGSCFVQIGDENVHRVRAIMDEVFGDENFVSLISFTSTSGIPSNTLSRAGDYIIWYAKKIENIKYRHLLEIRRDDEISHYNLIYENGYTRRFSIEEKNDTSVISKNASLATSQSLTSQGETLAENYIILEGIEFNSPPGQHWKTTTNGIKNLYRNNRILFQGKSIRYLRLINDFKAKPYKNLWTNTVIGSQEKNYVVQTSTKVIERCILMSTDPGDLVLDPTCLRKGTMVAVVNSPRSFPQPREAGSELPCPEGSLLCEKDNEKKQVLTPPFQGGWGVTQKAPNSPVHGGRGEEFGVPIENILPGDYVIGHDGKPHKVIRTIQKEYIGRMVGIKHKLLDKTLWMTADHKVLIQKRKVSFGGERSWKHVPYENFQKAKDLRKNPTSAENQLWELLKQELPKIKFRRQHPIGAYITDFYSRELHTVIEVDGEIHNQNGHQEYDRVRDNYLKSAGMKVLRFSNSDVFSSSETVISKIKEIQNNRAIEDKEWMRADFLQKGDIIYYGEEQQAVEIQSIEYEETKEIVYDLEVEGCHSYLTEVCMVHNCGSGTTAYVAEQWGRRWITIDTSRVALALARARLMGARYPYYLLSDSKEGQQKEAEITKSVASSQPTYNNIKHGFVYERVPHITLKSIANNTEIDVIWENWQPKVEGALKSLNKAMRGYKTPYKSPTGGREGKEIKFDAKEKEKHKLASGEEVPVYELLDWEVPREMPKDWSKEAKKHLDAYWEARIARQKEIDASIAAKADMEKLYDKPYENKSTIRVSGPFTVESMSPHKMVSPNMELPNSKEQTDFVSVILENLKTAGAQHAHKEDKIDFTSITPWPGDLICAEGKYNTDDGKEMRAAIFVGPEYATVTRPDLVEVAREASETGFHVLVACAFNFEAMLSEFDKLGRIPIIKARMNADLHMAADLRNNGKGNLFVVFGEPDIDILTERNGELKVKIKGVDVFDPNTGEVRADGPDGIACWFVDTDYNEESFFVRQAYFLGAGDPYKSLKTSLKAEINPEAWQSLYSNTSRPFPKPNSGRIAVKVINHLGDEVMKIFRV
ncbi:MAG: DUF559 domain-containing protein [Leptospiraceae bacterium]|nr:DUF559 domain-containing protein [Leptospiraceae bacterium]